MVHFLHDGRIFARRYIRAEIWIHYSHALKDRALDASRVLVFRAVKCVQKLERLLLDVSSGGPQNLSAELEGWLVGVAEVRDGVQWLVPYLTSEFLGRILFCRKVPWLHGSPFRFGGARTLLVFLLIKIHIFVVDICASRHQGHGATVWHCHEFLSPQTFRNCIRLLLTSVIKRLAILFQGIMSFKLTLSGADCVVFFRGCWHGLIVGVVTDTTCTYNVLQVPPIIQTVPYLPAFIVFTVILDFLSLI